jgi:ATP-GRASP peptide maturase of grasp-with-spasm system
MILILSQEGMEPTTDAVMEWIRHLGGDCVRVNGADLAGDVAVRMGVDRGGPVARLTVDGREVTSRDVRVVWLWRWHARPPAPARPQPGAEALAEQINTHLKGETNAVSGAFFSLFRHARWLGSPEEAALGKIHALQAAAEAGLDLPATLVTNRRADLERFRAEHGRVIAKSVGEAGTLKVDGRYYAMYTAEPTDRVMAELPETLFPSLLQEMVEKAFEIRTFYLDGRVWSMAIFSQGGTQSAVDLRQNDGKKPLRRVPYRLPEPVEAAVGRLMVSLGLSSGSLDLVRTPDGRHVFLEVNPAGQFGMMSIPCNYYLPRRVAEYLIAEDAHVRA